MNYTSIIFVCNFFVVFGFLAAVVFVLRMLARIGKKSKRKQIVLVGPAIMENGRPEWAARNPQENLAPPPRPRDDLDYQRAAEYVLDTHSSYSVPQPHRNVEDEW
jgi:hypothetical protein